MRPIAQLGLALVVTAAIACVTVLALTSGKPAAQDDQRAQIPAPTSQPAPVQAGPELDSESSGGRVDPVTRLPLVDESTSPRRHGSVAELMAGILDARARDDRAWLCRALLRFRDQDQLTDEHAQHAYHRFTWSSVKPLWDKIEAAWREGKSRLDEKGDSAVLVLDIGGNAGSAELHFARVNDAWFLQD